MYKRKKMEEEKEKEKIKQFKLKESYQKAIFSTFSTILIIFFISKKDYAWSFQWNEWVIPGLWDFDVPTIEETFIYMLQIGWYVFQTYKHLKVDSMYQKSDHNVLFVHHIITILLMTGSYYVGYHRIGLLVLSVHEPCDIFLEGAKIANYRKNTLVSVLAFINLVILWVVLRLYIFGRLILNCYWHSLVHTTNAPAILTFLLCILFCMNLYWLGLIGKIIHNVVKNGLSHAVDIREEEKEKKEKIN